MTTLCRTSGFRGTQFEKRCTEPLKTYELQNYTFLKKDTTSAKQRAKISVHCAMTVSITAVLYMKFEEGGGLSTQGVREIGELVRKTHHVHPNRESNNRSNVVLDRISMGNIDK